MVRALPSSLEEGGRGERREAEQQQATFIGEELGSRARTCHSSAAPPGEESAEREAPRRSVAPR